MTEAHEPNDIDGPHEGPIKTPKQLMLAVLYAFVVPIFGIVLLVTYVSSDKRPGAGSDAFSPAAVSARIRPVGVVEVKDSTDVASMKSGEQVFAAQCTACHTAGALGAPKLGDAGAWAARVRTGYEALLHSALAGKGQMPPQGGGDYNDLEIGRAVVYMANQGGAKFPVPAAPALATVNAPSTATAAMQPAVASASAPRGDANAGTPAGLPTSNLNAQVRADVPEAIAGKSTAVAAAATKTPAATATTAAPAATTAAATPPALYTQICSVCHAAGVAGAPKLGDKAAWAPRIAQGIDALTASAIKGKGAMPPKGGSNAPDADIRAVVTWMTNSSK